MEIAITAPVSGRVREVFVARNVQVDAGAPLFRIEPLSGDAADMPVGAAIDLAALQRVAATDPLQLALDRLESVRAFVLGFDVEAGTCGKCSNPPVAIEDSCGADRRCWYDAGWRSSTRSPTSVRSPERGAIPTPTATTPTCPREYFNSYLRSLDVEREGVPAWFGDALLRALAHYGVTRLDRSPELEEALLRIFVRTSDVTSSFPIVMALLDDHGPASVGHDGADEIDIHLRATLDRLIDATQRRYPAIAGMSRTVRYRRFDQPLVDRRAPRSRPRCSGSPPASPMPAATAPGHDRRAGRLSAAAAAHPRRRQPVGHGRAPAPLLEVLTRRYYKIRDLAPPRVELIGDHEVCVAQYARHDRSVHVVAIRASDLGMADALAAVAAVVRAGASARHRGRRRLPAVRRWELGDCRQPLGGVGRLARFGVAARRSSAGRPDRLARRVGPHGAADLPSRR